MSVLIKGMKMPKSCCDCQFAVDGTCVAMQPIKTRNWREKDTTNFCPLIPVPDHGDLVDIDMMLDDFAELRDYDFASREYVVIPSERSEVSLCDNCDERSDVGCSWCKKMERSEE